MKTIFGLVGQSGAGKTTLIQEIVKRLPDSVAVVTSLTSRSRRDAEDDQFYEFITADEMRRRETEGRLVQVSEYAGNLYANDRQKLDDLLKEKFGITALVEDGVNKLRHAGYHVMVVKILPVHNHGAAIPTPAAERLEADKKRAQIILPADIILNNSFEPGGLAKAVDQLAHYIRSFAN